MVINLLKLARAQFLVAGLALFIFGALVAVLFGAPFSWARLLVGCLIVLPAQLSVNFGNDYFDVVSDQIGGTTLISGGSGVLLKHPELRKPVKGIITGLILLSLSAGVLFQQAYAYPFWMLGFVVLGNLLGWMYSAPPFRLSQRGLGELCFVFVVALLLPTMGYLTMQGALDPWAVSLLIPLLLYGFVFILSVEIPDMEDDRLGEKKTWIAHTGRSVGFTLIGLLLLGATGYFFIMSQLPRQPIPFVFRMAGWLSLLPLVPGLWGLVQRPTAKGQATPIATAIVILLALFALLMDVYLFILSR